jgi:hypothetical protein
MLVRKPLAWSFDQTRDCGSRPPQPPNYTMCARAIVCILGYRTCWLEEQCRSLGATLYLWEEIAYY